MANTNTNKAGKMDNATIANMLVGSTESIVMLNHEAVKAMRAYCWDKGYDPAALYAEEEARITSTHWGAMGLADYLKASRVGSRHLLNRKVRRWVWLVFATRRILGSN